MAEQMHEKLSPMRFAMEKYKKAQISFLIPIQIPTIARITIIISNIINKILLK